MGRLLRTLGISGVPATGYFGAGWPLGTILLLYWLETVLVTLVVAALIVRHRRTTRKAGHWNVEPIMTTTSSRRSKTTFLGAFLGVMLPFTAAHGVFVAIFAFLFFPERLGSDASVSFRALALGMGGIALFLGAGFLLDLLGVAQRPFRWVERLAERAQGRMLVTHFSILFGGGALAIFGAPLAFFAVFVGLKSLFDLGGLLPDREPRRKPPRPLGSLDRRLPVKDGKTFSQHYREKIDEELSQREANEQVLMP